jgi:benzoate/toluate 1,2-dioxygenase subunit beta
LSAELGREVERFLYDEARLLDHGRFEAWLALFAPDGIYWIPSVPGQTDPLGVPSIVYEDCAILAMRVRRLMEARALVMMPKPRTAHLVSNIELIEGRAGEINTEANFLVVESRDRRQQLFAGHVIHRLRRMAGALRIVLKRVELLDCDGVHGPISILL